MNKKTVQDVFDARLSGIEVTDAQRRAVMQRIYGEEKPVKRKLSTSILIAALMLALLAATAVAAHLFTRTPEADAVQAARQALMDKYDLTPPTLGLFLDDAQQQKGEWVVTFTGYAAEMFDRERMGTYRVALRGDKATDITWTHDAVDPADWKDLGLDAPVWGQPQLLEALAEQERENLARAAYWQEREAQERAAVEAMTLTGEQAAGAIAAAKQALVDAYGFTEDTLGLYTASAMGSGKAEEDIIVTFAPDAASIHPLFTWLMGEYSVTLDAQSGEVTQTVWSQADAWDDGAYTKANWATAPAYHASLLPWLAELHGTLAAIAAPYGGGHAWEIGLNFIDAAAFDQAFRDAGFPADEGFHRVPPGEDELTYEEASGIAKAALMEDTGIAEDDLGTDGLSAERIVQKDGTPKYNFMFTVYKDGFCAVYSVYMDARSGVVESVEVVTGGNG